MALVNAKSIPTHKRYECCRLVSNKNRFYVYATICRAAVSDSFRFADKPLVSPLPKEIAAFLLDCR